MCSVFSTKAVCLKWEDQSCMCKLSMSQGHFWWCWTDNNLHAQLNYWWINYSLHQSIDKTYCTKDFPGKAFFKLFATVNSNHWLFLISIFFLELKGEEGWTKLNYAENFDTSLGTVRDNVPRQDCNKISKSEFVERYEKPRIPVVLTHTMDHWKSMRKWTVEVWGIYL